MAIINCPGCGKKTTELSSKCPHCGFVRGQEEDERKVELQRRKMRDHLYHLKMTSYAVITLFLVAFSWYWYETAGFLEQSSIGPFVMLAIVSAGYLILRVLMFRAKRSLKQLSS
jgi:ribosomal protein L37E